MEKNQLSINLRDEADGLGLCGEWHDAWSDKATQQELVNKYLRGIDFCLLHRWPSADFVEKNFDRHILRRSGVLANDRYSLRNKREIVLLGNSEAVVRIDGPCSSRIYACDTSFSKIYVRTSEKVIIEVRDHANVEVIPDAGYDTDVVVYEYSDESVVVAPNSVRYRKENDYLYEDGG